MEGKNEGIVKDDATVVGRVTIGKGTTVMDWSVIREPCIVGENCKIGPNAYIGQFAAIGDWCVIVVAEVGDSIVIEDTMVNVERKIVRSMRCKGSRILSTDGLIPNEGEAGRRGEYDPLSCVLGSRLFQGGVYLA